ncbi:DUF6445 family protein [Asticcacaulis solisilvae]|uniref:DUF6445 family protein n=1 Tax=Asticcacaulis solisilvae TaxID=1217274 RepID=UPI003FD81D1C
METGTLDLRLNPAARVNLRRIGRELNPVIVIDDVFVDSDAEALADHAAAADWAPPETTYYPGVNAALPPAYLQTLAPVLRPTFARGFGLPVDARLNAYGFFALATWGLERFGPLQRIPHYDQPNPKSLAMVHYLCKGQGGGTAFFRHHATGYESIDAVRREGYMLTVADEIERDNQLLINFAGPDTPNYEMVDRVEMRFNRIVLYQSNILHCALFDGAVLSDDPRTGRLTANTFYAFG